MNQKYFWNQNAIRVSLTTTTARSAALSPGKYRMLCDVDAFVKQGKSGSVTAVVATSNPIFAGEWYILDVPQEAGIPQNDCVAGILAAGTGTLFLIPLELV